MNEQVLKAVRDMCESSGINKYFLLLPEFGGGGGGGGGGGAPAA